YGASGSSERALGSLASGANISKIGVTLVNNTASTISSFTVTFDGEIWHRGDQATTVNKLAFDYEIGTGAALGDAGVYTPVPQLNVNVPSTATGTNTAVDGNAAANRTAGVTYTFSGVSWGAGQNLVLRWSDANEGGNDDGLSVDNVRLALPSVAGTVGFSNPTDDANENDGVATISMPRNCGT